MVELESGQAGWAATLEPAAVARLVEDCGGDATILDALVAAFCEDGAALLAGLHGALRTRRPEDVRLAAHTLKSHGLTFGSPLLAHVAREVEWLARDGDLQGAAAHVAELEAEYERTREALVALAFQWAV